MSAPAFKATSTMSPKRRHGLPIEERIERFSIPEPMSGCFLWTASLDSSGYGHLTVNGLAKRAHRAAWEHAHRVHLPPSMYVLHRCDNRTCVNVDHLFVGSHDDNMKDMAKKGRSVGVSGNAKITAEDASFIRASSVRTAVIARQFGISTSSVRRIRRAETWKDRP